MIDILITPQRLILTSVLIFSPKVDISQKSMLGFSSTSFSSEPSPQNVCSMIFECWQPLPILLGNCFHRRCVHNRSATFLATFHKNTSFTLVSSDKSSLHYPPPSTTHPPQKYGSSAFHSAQRPWATKIPKDDGYFSTATKSNLHNSLQFD